MTTGIIVIIVGTLIAQIEYFHIAMEAVGYLVHGLGTVPFIEHINNKVNGRI